MLSHLGTITYSDQDLVIIEEFCAHIRENLDYATFEGKRRILELLDVRGTLAVEDDQKVVYVSCLISPQPVSLVLTLPLSSTDNRQQGIMITARLVVFRNSFPLRYTKLEVDSEQCIKQRSGGHIELDTFWSVARGMPQLAEFESATIK